jgi:hypothetical protein
MWVKRAVQFGNSVLGESSPWRSELIAHAMGCSHQWRVYQNYIRDTISLKWSSIDNAELEFSNPPKTSPTPVSGELAQTVK